MLSFSARTEEWLLRNLDFNPAIARRDIRARNRRAKPWVVGPVYLGALCLFACLPLLIGDTPRLSRDVFTALMHAQTLLLVILMTGSAASATTKEREKRTEDALRMTRLTSTDIIVGALIGLLDQPLVLLVASLPFTMWAVVLGEVSLLQVILCLTLTLATVAAVGALVLTNPGNMGTIWATAAAYVGVIVLYQFSSVLLIVSATGYGVTETIGTGRALMLIGIAWIGLGSVAVSITDWFLARRRGAGSVSEQRRVRRRAITWVLVALLGVLLSCVPWVASAPRHELAALSPHMAVQRVLGADGPWTQYADEAAAMWPGQVQAWAISMIGLLLVTHVLCRIAIAAHTKRNRRQAETVNNPRG